MFFSLRDSPILKDLQIAHWVTYSILCKDDPRRRAAVMKQFIQVADVSLPNFMSSLI